MDSAAVALAPGIQATQAPHAPEALALLSAARGGDMSLQVLMDRAQALQSAGQAETAALLYET